MKNESNVAIELQSLRGNVLQQIQSLAQTGDTTGLFKANDWLRSAVSFASRYENLVCEAQQLIVSGRELLQPRLATAEPPDEAELAEGDSESVGGKPRGRECREAFVKREKQRGKILTKVDGQLYRNGSGIRIGIGYGKRNNDSKWFLGLKAGQFQEAVLLCEMPSGKIQPFWLPRDFVDKHGGQLSISKRWNQVKFNVVRIDGRFLLSVPRIGRVDITLFADPEPMNPPQAIIEQ